MLDLTIHFGLIPTTAGREIIRQQKLVSLIPGPTNQKSSFASNGKGRKE